MHSFHVILVVSTWLFTVDCQRSKLTRDDIVVALPIDDAHTVVAKAGRAWRKGIRTIIATNSTPSHALVREGEVHGETWVYYPDDKPPLRALYPGDVRAAVVPFLAHKYLGATYKWMLYGDDDTLFFLDGILDLLQDFDPEIPYFISDHYWWCPQPQMPIHPRNDAPRCLPCHFDETKAGVDVSKAPYRANKGCPCTPQLICTLPEFADVFHGGCDIPRHPQRTYSMHGGSGAIISVGLLRKVDLSFVEKCIQGDVSTGGDAFISICLWKAGYGMTDPGWSFYHPEFRMFDAGPEDRFGLLLRLSKALERKCDASCQMMLEKLVSVHVRSRHFPSLEHAGRFITAVVAMYDSYVAMRKMDAQLIAAGLLPVTDGST